MQMQQAGQAPRRRRRAQVLRVVVAVFHCRSRATHTHATTACDGIFCGTDFYCCKCVASDTHNARSPACARACFLLWCNAAAAAQLHAAASAASPITSGYLISSGSHITSKTPWVPPPPPPPPLHAAPSPQMQRKCHSCGGSGHIKAQCPVAAARPHNHSSGACFSCGTMGHRQVWCV